MVQLSEMLPPRPEAWWPLLKQCGVDTVVGLLNGAEQDQRMFAAVGAQDFGAAGSGPAPWSFEAIRRDKALFAEHGFKLIGLEDTAPMDNARLGLPGRDQEIESVIEQIRAMGRLEIPTLCYNWMAIRTWGRTDVSIPARGGALVSGFRLADSEALPPFVAPGEVTSDQLWSALKYFLDAVIPEAEAAGVRLGLHPDDPPRPPSRQLDRNLPRIMGTVDAYRKLLALHPSPSNGITFCQGNWALMEEVISGQTSLPDLITELAPEHIAFVHFRDVRGTLDDFRETFHDEGQTDLPSCMKAYAGAGFAGPMRPDHVPTMEGESNARPGYETLGRLFALGYIRGLHQAAYGCHPAAGHHAEEVS
ncbi:mannonate dehydratase [Nocardioides baekrokdamisoli]|uniref:mannonate dehydratase n=1 Tax=Nocardioides baekrokdamisoli TaxID=1804624 RepID=A0A3G9IYG2_9ACTN|nr:mannonate dehydratase [Nocardioides baekrokdamisoli]BBH17463.1 mannonate dehydratase [Nocardioides baekrokdamisoli]